MSICGGIYGITVIVIGSVLDYQIQILNKAVCSSHDTNILGKGMNPNIFSPAMGKWYGRWELQSLYIYIYILLYSCFLRGFFLSHGPIEYEYFLNRSIRPIGRTLTCATTPGLSGPGHNGNEGVIHTLLISRTRASPSDTVRSLTQNIWLGKELRHYYSKPICFYFWNL